MVLSSCGAAQLDTLLQSRALTSSRCTCQYSFFLHPLSSPPDLYILGGWLNEPGFTPGTHVRVLRGLVGRQPWPALPRCLAVTEAAELHACSHRPTGASTCMVLIQKSDMSCAASLAAQQKDLSCSKILTGPVVASQVLRNKEGVHEDASDAASKGGVHEDASDAACKGFAKHLARACAPVLRAACRRDSPKMSSPRWTPSPSDRMRDPINSRRSTKVCNPTSAPQRAVLHGMHLKRSMRLCTCLMSALQISGMIQSYGKMLPAKSSLQHDRNDARFVWIVNFSI